MVEIAGKQIPKWFVVLVAVLLIGVLSGIVNRCTGGAIQRERADNAAAPAESPPLPAYEIVKVEDISAGATPRFQYRVAVEGQPTPGELQVIADEVFETAKTGKDFSALSIGFFDYPEFARGQYTLGSVEYAPGGDWAAASNIKPGEYNSMKAKAELPTKDWSGQLTADEVAVSAAWWAEYDAAAKVIGTDPSKLVDEVAVTNMVAQSTGKSADEVQAILIKQQVWTSQ